MVADGHLELHSVPFRHVRPSELRKDEVEAVELAVDTSGFHFLDKDTGHAIGYPDTAAGNGRG